jgi:4-aminobutyrate aminotransferase/(S)-3-amino-2-methylpropionate transaminase
MLESTRIKTEIPGPKSRALMERRHNAVSSGVGIATPMFAKEAKGALLTDVDGNTFIDFGGGIGWSRRSRSRLRGSPTAASTSPSTRAI